MTTTITHTLHYSPAHRLTITARVGLSGEWLVQFVRYGPPSRLPNRTTKQLDRCAAWLPSGCWDERRWHPTTTRLVPPAALVEVERWLRGRGES